MSKLKKIVPLHETPVQSQQDYLVPDIVEVSGVFVPGILEEIPVEKRIEKIQEIKKEFEKKIKACGLTKVPKQEISDEDKLKQSIDYSKEFVKEHQDAIQKDIENMVALYNIGDKKAFYFITPAEARLAIEYINETRQSGKNYLKEQNERDNEIEDFFTKETFKTNPTAISEENKNDIQVQIDSLIEHRINKKTLPYFANKKPFPFYQYTIKSETNTLTVDLINSAFQKVECFDLTVYGMILNSKRYADVRSMGKVIYDELTLREIIRRQKKKTKTMGVVFTADIYMCNLLEDNQIILYNSNAGVFFDMRIIHP